MKIAVVAPSCTLTRQSADRLEALVQERGDCEVMIHPQCFLADGHFAGPDDARLSALREVMADPSFDAVWFARGGYGSNRIAEAAVASLPDAFHKAGLQVAWGPMPQDFHREAGQAAVTRALDWIVRREPSSLEPELQGPAMAFNLTVLAALLGTVLEPDFSGVDLLIEDVSEHHYRIDRTMFHVTASPNVRRVSRLRLGRVGHIPANDPDFGRDELAIVQEWCERSGIPFGGRADIGHDVFNRVVPFTR
jgi:muramoyltetrapeptide carboxypeptidase